MFEMLYGQQMGTGIVRMLPTQPLQDELVNKQQFLFHYI